MMAPIDKSQEAPRGFSTAEAMAILKISHATLYRLLASGKLTARKVGSRTIIDAGSIDTYWKSLPTATFRTPKAVA